ncbi:MAG: radical SAM protein [Sumerlaeia bacterium]
MPPATVSPLREAARAVKRAHLEGRLRRATGQQVKAANADLNWREFWHGRSELRSRPRLMQIGTNWTCNLKCNFCRLTLDSTQAWLKAKPPRELEISPRVLEEVMGLMPYPEMMTLTPLGEPLLYSKFGRMLERHAELGSDNLAMTSNLNLVNEDRARMIVEGGLSHVFVSVDSSDPDIYASMRVRGTLDKVEAGLDNINTWKSRLGNENPSMTLASTFMERNVRQMPDLVDFALKHKFEVFSIQLMETENEELEGEFLGHHIELAKEMVLKTLKRAEGTGLRVRVHLALRNLLTAHLSLPEWRRITAHTEGAAGEDVAGSHEPLNHAEGQNDDIGKLSTHGKKLIDKCHYPWYFLVIDTDGDCRPCCWTGMSFGNLNDKGFDAIWNGEGAQGMRRDFLNDHIPKVCQGKHCRVDLDHSGTME